MRINNLDFHIVMAGPADGPLVILLHGFPEFWYGWRRQIPALAAAGYHAVLVGEHLVTSGDPSGALARLRVPVAG